MFNPVRIRLTLLYTCSFFALLILFILLLSYFITNTIERQQQEKLFTYIEEEHEDFLEDLHKKKMKGVELKEDRAIFYYLYNSQEQLVKGKETIPGYAVELSHILAKNPDSSFTKEVTWNNSHLLLIKMPLQEKGMLQGYVVVGTDITSEIHLIEKIVWGLIFLTIIFGLLLAILSHYLAGRAMKPIQKAFENQKQFVSDASHELRTPLTIFFSTLELLEREEKDKLSPFGQDVLNNMKEEAILMNKLLENLLMIARDDQNQLFIEKETVCLSELMKAIGKRFAVTVPPQIKFQLNIEEQVFIDGDSVRIQQLLYILLDNALLYTDKGKIELTLKKSPSQIIIEVTDTGRGINTANLQNIFTRFYREDTSRVRDGTGLGLSIAKTITELHGGEIIAKSEYGKGSTFMIIFPVKRNETIF